MNSITLEAGQRGGRPRRALARKPSSNPTWATLESLAVDYLALPPAPPAPPAPAMDPERERLRKAILHRLMGTFMQVVADDMASEVATEVPHDLADDDAPDLVSDIAQRHGAAGLAASPTLVESAPLLARRDSALEVVLRAEAKKLALRHANDGLVRGFGSASTLAAEAQQGLVSQRLERYDARRQTLLTGLLREWDSTKGSLYTFISVIARSFLVDMARQQFGGAENDSASSGSKVAGAPKPRVPRRKTAEPLSATPAHWDMIEALGTSSDDAAAWLDQHMPHQAPSSEELLAGAEMRVALHAAVATLPAELGKLFALELLKHDDDELSDAELAQRMGCSRNTLLKHRARLHQALRKNLGEGAAPD